MRETGGTTRLCPDAMRPPGCRISRLSAGRGDAGRRSGPTIPASPGYPRHHRRRALRPGLAVPPRLPTCSRQHGGGGKPRNTARNRLGRQALGSPAAGQAACRLYPSRQGRHNRKASNHLKRFLTPSPPATTCRSSRASRSSEGPARGMSGAGPLTPRLYPQLRPGRHDPGAGKARRANRS